MLRILSAVVHFFSRSLHRFVRSRIAAELPGTDKMPWDRPNSVGTEGRRQSAGRRSLSNHLFTLDYLKTTDVPIVGVL